MAIAEGIIVHDPFADYEPLRPERKQRYVPTVELERIMHTPLSDTSLYPARDMFLIACFTGISYVDLKNLTPQEMVRDAEGAWWIASRRQKTGVTFNVPLLDIPLKLIEKYKPFAPQGKLLPVPGYNTLHAHLKQIGRICGIETPVTFHQARHTYATEITLANGVQLESVSSMLGHSHTATTLIYANTTIEKIGRDMIALEFRIEGKFSLAI